MFQIYILRLIFRCCVFIAAVCAYFFKPNLFIDFFSYKLSIATIPVYVVWATMMLDMALQFFPNSISATGSQKQHGVFYTPAAEAPERSALAAYIKRSNVTASYVLLIWLAVFGAVAVLYLTGTISGSETTLICLLFYVCDMICVLFWCPFQSIFMKNRCCATCRIYNWDWFMICSPLVFTNSFFSWSLIAVSVIVLVKWEITWKKHPERFWDKSNAALLCVSCTEKMCRLKAPVGIEKG